MEIVILKYMDYLTEKGVSPVRDGNTIKSDGGADIEFRDLDGDIYYTVGLSKNYWIKWEA